MTHTETYQIDSTVVVLQPGDMTRYEFVVLDRFGKHYTVVSIGGSIVFAHTFHFEELWHLRATGEEVIHARYNQYKEKLLGSDWWGYAVDQAAQLSCNPFTYTAAALAANTVSMMYAVQDDGRKP